MENSLHTQNKNALHYFEAMTPKIQGICEGLASLGITHFWYDKFLPDGKYLSLGNDIVWKQHFYAQDLFNLPNYLISSVKKTPLHQEWSLILDNHSDQKCALLAEQQKFNIGHNVSLLSKMDDYAETFTFASTTENTQIINFYMRHVDVLKSFCTFFKEKVSPLIKLCDVKQMASLNEKIVLLGDPEPPSWQHNISSFLEKTALYPSLFDDTPLHYSKREEECLFHISAGKSAKEIARDIGISHRTVESYIANIKKKVGCRKQTDLVRIFTEYRSNSMKNNHAAA